MTFALILAGVFAAFALLLLFVWPVMWAVPGTRLNAVRGPEARFMAGMIVTLALAAALFPFATAALISGGGAVHQIFASVPPMSFGL